MTDLDELDIHQTRDGLTVAVSVIPRSPKNEIIGVQNRALKVRLTAAPVEGAANKALVAFLAKHTGLPKSKVKIVAGQKSRHKKILFVEADRDLLMAKLL